jgi:phosphohistidine phosphatase
MRLLVVRHGIAEDRDAWARTGEDDTLRPLTDEGRRKMRGVARGLARVGPTPDVLASSPLTRAVQTADILDRAYGGVETMVLEQLTPERHPADLLGWLRMCASESTIAVVGHEPHLSDLLSWLLTGREGSFIQLKKGGACLLSFQENARAGSAMLRWALTPTQLRRLGR